MFYRYFYGNCLRKISVIMHPLFIHNIASQQTINLRLMLDFVERWNFTQLLFPEPRFCEINLLPSSVFPSKYYPQHFKCVNKLNAPAKICNKNLYSFKKKDLKKLWIMHVEKKMWSYRYSNHCFDHQWTSLKAFKNQEIKQIFCIRRNSSG